MIKLPPQSHPTHDERTPDPTSARLFRIEWYKPLVAIVAALNSPLVRYGTTIQHGLLSATAVQDGTLFLETDTESIYQARLVNNLPAWVQIDIPTGASNLTTPGQLVMVDSTPGSLTESAANDDGTTVTVDTRDVDITGGGVLKIAGTQVVGPQGAALTAPVGGVGAAPALYSQIYMQTVADLANNLLTRVIEIEDRLQAHGLIA